MAENSECANACWLKRFLFGSIRKKLGFAFGILILLLIILVFVTYSISIQIAEDETYLREVNTPLGLMVEQVIGYDAILTGNAHEALLHAEKGEFEILKEHKQKYDNAGVLLDDLLNVKVKELINNSRRGVEEKNRVYYYLSELDKVNLALVDLEIGAFEAMEKGEVDSARSLIVTEQYENYKKELADLYRKWADEENRISREYEQRILDNSRKVEIYNLYMGILFIIIASLIPFIMNGLIARPLGELKKATEEIEKGDFNQNIEIRTGDEIEELGKAFNKMSQALAKTDEERAKIDKAKTEFLSITSHELRSPMTPMRAQLQMLIGEYFGKVSKEQKESLEIVLRNTERLDRIIQDFLEISRIEAARLKFNFIKTSLESYAKQVVEEMKGFMPEKKIQISLDMEKLPVIEVDPDRVMQVLRNLLNNAIKFSKDNGKIIVKVAVKGKFVYFMVKDNGIGIKKEDQIRLFEPFYQVGGMYDRKVGGTGLGLAICKGIIQSQNGRIWFESEYGKGTNFYFTIPFEPVKEMKPIKILFSNKENIEEEMKKIFLENLGPLGEKELEDLKAKGLVEEVLLEYVNELVKSKIIRDGEEFKNKILLVLDSKSGGINQKKGEIGLNELRKSGFIKEDKILKN